MKDLVAEFNRRQFLKAASLMGVAAMAPLPAFAANGTLTIADIGVGDPGDWSRYTKASGYNVNVVAIGNAPSAIVNQMVVGGGTRTFSIINIVGGMQEPLAQEGLIRELDTSRMPNWEKNTYISEFLGKGTPGYRFITYDDKVYGVPSVLQADSFAYIPEITGELDSYAALFDPKFRGYVALEDNFTTSAQKTALYLKKNNMAEIADPSDMTESEIDTVSKFLIEKKKEGQFRVIWSSFEQAVNLLVNREIHVMDCWEPMVIAANQKKPGVVYAKPREGYLLWAMNAYLVNNPDHSEADITAAYELLNFLLGPWYGAVITERNGYLTNPQALTYAEQNPSEFNVETIRRVNETVKSKFEVGGTWQTRWPKNIAYYEEAWQRFMSA